MKTKDWLLIIGCIVAPAGFFVAGAYYGPKIRKWYVDKNAAKKTTSESSEGSVINSDLVEIKNIDEANKKITLSINKNPEISFSYRTGGVPMAQMISVSGLESTDMALRYVDGKFLVTDGTTVLFEQQIEKI